MKKKMFLVAIPLVCSQAMAQQVNTRPLEPINFPQAKVAIVDALKERLKCVENANSTEDLKGCRPPQGVKMQMGNAQEQTKNK